MPARKPQKKMLAHSEKGNADGEWLRDLILGGQDGLVNTLGLVLGVAAATSDVRIVIIAGLAAMFAEGISMGAVAYTSTKAAKEYYERERARELWEINHHPNQEKKEVRDIYFQKGFRGKQLEMVVHKLTSNRKRWLNTMMGEELKLSSANETPLRSGIVVGVAAHIGAVFPLLPFFFFPLSVASFWVAPFCLAVLFLAGAIKGRFTKVPWWRSGLELALIGGAAALIGYLIGKWLSIPIV